MTDNNAPSPLAFLRCSNDLLGIPDNASHRKKTVAFRDCFKVTPGRCSELFPLIRHHPALPDDVSLAPKHLLWTLHFMHTYGAERQRQYVMKADRRTIRKFVWPVIIALADLESQFVSSKFTFYAPVHPS
jgi:hypothetical protein